MPTIRLKEDTYERLRKLPQPSGDTPTRSSTRSWTSTQNTGIARTEPPGEDPMTTPQHIDESDGALYVLTHPKKFTKEEWTQAMLSCLTGEHGAKAKQMVLTMAAQTNTKIPDELL